MKFFVDFKHGFKEGVLDLLWLAEEIWEMWSGHFSRAWKYFFPIEYYDPEDEGEDN